MKIYCIKIDSMPFCSEVLQMQKLIKGSLTRQVSGCFTTETVVQMLTGKYSSLLHSHGIGYNTWTEQVQDLSIALYVPIDIRPDEGLPNWSWLKQSIPCLLAKKEFKVKAKDPGVLCGVLGFLRYPEFYQRSLISLFKSNETGDIEYIKQIQNDDDKKVLHFINYAHYHRACDSSSNLEEMHNAQKQAGEDVLKILSAYDFTEPDSLFWIYSDHGPWRFPEFGGYPKPLNFFTWSIIKDNTKNPISPTLPVSSAQDFYQAVLSKFDNNLKPFPQDKDRIYITEDGRMSINSLRSTTAMACKFCKWVDNMPLLMKQIIYHEPDNKFVQNNIVFDEVENYETVEPEDDLKNSLRSSFDWVF